VRRTPHPGDRRKLLVDVTDEARAILDELLPSLHDRERKLMDAALTKDEQRRLLEIVAKVQSLAGEMADELPDRSARRIRTM
jgi:DNA-binding MarR family transcriptional regulator